MRQAGAHALAKLLPMQRQDFVELFEIMHGLPVTIRLLDPPLHEFLPQTEEEMAEVAKAAGADVAALKARNAQLHEANPMLGHRGCRLGITYPEIYEMQARAIFEAAVEVSAKLGKTVIARDHDPAGLEQEGIRHHEGAGRPHRQSGVRREASARCPIWSAP